MNTKVNFSLTQIEYVLAVYKHGHFARAAEACHVTQPTLSMQIQKLEEELDVVIFDRSKKPILLTTAGRQIIEQLQSVLFEAKKVTSMIHASKEKELEGEINIGIIPTIAPDLLPRLLPLVDKSLSGLKLSIMELQTHRIIEALNNDEIDVGILALPLKIPKIIEFPLYYEPFSILCHKNHDLAKHKKIHYSDLKYGDVWLLEEGHCLRHQIIDVCSLKPKIDHRKFKFESGSLETLKNLVQSNGGYTLLPALSAENYGKDTRLIPFERPIPARQVGLVYRREHYKSELIEALGASIIDALPAEIQKIRQKDLDIIAIE